MGDKCNCVLFADCVIITLAILIADTSCAGKEWVLTHSLRFVKDVISQIRRVGFEPTGYKSCTKNCPTNYRE